MDIPFLLLVLLAMPFAVAGVIVAVSSARRRRHTADHGSAPEPHHRGQADSAAVQSAAVHPEATAPKLSSGRDRRAESARTSTDG